MNEKRKSQVTIKDIAKHLGVSFSTVSKALNDDPLVAEDTRKRVHEKAAEMGYFPNLMAIGLRSNQTKTIGMILNDIENPTRSHIIKRISMDMARYGYTSFIFDSSYDEAIERKNIINMLSRLPDSVIISPVNTNFKNLALLEDIFDRTIILSKKKNQVQAHYVHMDHIRGGYIAASTMLAMGHTQNLVIMEPTSYPSGAQYYEGVKQAYRDHGLELDPSMLFYGYPSIEDGRKIITSLYDQQNKIFKRIFTGVIASNDMIAIGVYKAAVELGIKIPGDISVIGCDDDPIASLVSPQLTTLIYPKEKIADCCSEILVNKLVKNNSEMKHFSLEPELVVRDSIRKI